MAPCDSLSPDAVFLATTIIELAVLLMIKINVPIMAVGRMPNTVREGRSLGP